MSPWQVLALRVEQPRDGQHRADRSTSVIANSCLRCTALCPPPLPSSSTVGAARPGADGRFEVRSSEAANAASSAYSSGVEISGHQVARSP